MKKILRHVLFFIFILIFIPQISAQTENLLSPTEFPPTFATSFEGSEHIRDFQNIITVNKNGTISVQENLIYDFSTLDRHGIYREIPFVTTNQESKRFRLDFSNFSVTDENGKKYEYTKSIENGKIRLKIGDSDRTITGVHTYIINYEVAGALTYFSDHDELYWNITGNEWNIPIAHANSTIKLSSEVDEEQVKVVCYSGTFGSTAKNCSTNVLGLKVLTYLNGSLNSNEGLTVAVSFPKGVVAVLEPKPYVTFWETIFGKIVIGFIILAAVLWYIIYPIWIPIKWFKQGRDPSASSGQVRAWFDPPKSKTGRDLTPEESGALIDERVDMEDVSSMVVSLAQRGYLKIEERKKGDFYFLKQKEFTGDKDLLLFEKDFMAELFGDSSEYHLKKNKLYTAVEKLKTSIYQKLVTEGFFAEDPNKIRTFYTVMGILGLTTGNIALAFTAFFFGRHMPKKTVLGVGTANVARSLKNFLSSQERQLKFQADKQLMFEKLLPFAIAFGVEKVWANRFKDINLKPPEWYSGYGGSTRFNSIYFTNSLNSSFSSLRSAATPVTSSTGHSSGFSGGSSGGGGGGGGGGSW